MAIPASVTLYTNWENGTLSGGVYTNASPDLPVGFQYSVVGSVGVWSTQPFVGQTLLDVGTAVNGYAYAVIGSTHVAATAGRLLIECTEISETNYDVLYVGAASPSNGYIRISKTSGSILRCRSEWNGYGSEAIVDLGSWPATVGIAIEVIYDLNNATAANRLKARWFTVGATAGAFSTASPSTGSAGTTDQFTEIKFARGDIDSTNLQFGRVIFSNSITEDLSLVSESTPQYLRPSSDISNAGSWLPSTGTTLYGVIDETTASDSDYIYTPDNPVAKVCEVKFGAGADPATGSGHIVRYKALSLNQDAVLTVSLYQGASSIASWVSSLVAGASAQAFAQTLSTAQADVITDYTDLRLRFSAG